MVGLTRFLCLMNLCERNGVSSNVYRGYALVKKDAKFRLVKKLFVLQGNRHKKDEATTALPKS
jgi:hypothetical protein